MDEAAGPVGRVEPPVTSKVFTRRSKRSSRPDYDIRAVRLTQGRLWLYPTWRGARNDVRVNKHETNSGGLVLQRQARRNLYETVLSLVLASRTYISLNVATVKSR